jgi:hypothetical protein
MEIAGFVIEVGELDGTRLIRTVFPTVFDSRRLWAAASSYPTLWDEENPTVTINDISMMGDFEESPEARNVVKWVLEQNQKRARLVATSWVYGDNDRAAAQIRSLLEEVGRSTGNLFARDDEALQYIRGRLAAYLAQPRDESAS